MNDRRRLQEGSGKLFPNGFQRGISESNRDTETRIEFFVSSRDCSRAFTRSASKLFKKINRTSWKSRHCMRWSNSTNEVKRLTKRLRRTIFLLEMICETVGVRYSIDKVVSDAICIYCSGAWTFKPRSHLRKLLSIQRTRHHRASQYP